MLAPLCPSHGRTWEVIKILRESVPNVSNDTVGNFGISFIAKSVLTAVQRHAHNKATRMNNNSVSLPKINTEYARQGSFYMGAQLYDDLPTSVRTAENRKSFVEKLDFFLNTKKFGV